AEDRVVADGVVVARTEAPAVLDELHFPRPDMASLDDGAGIARFRRIQQPLSLIQNGDPGAAADEAGRNGRTPHSGADDDDIGSGHAFRRCAVPLSGRKTPPWRG